MTGKKNNIANPFRETRLCESCNARYTAKARNAKYCLPCRGNTGRISDTRLLNYALKVMGKSRADIIDLYKLSNKNGVDMSKCTN